MVDMRCSKCGTVIDLGEKFCAECGAVIPQTKECPVCHVRLKLNAKFCSECGYGFASKEVGGRGVLIGDKNVIAGDVIGHQQDFEIAGNATFVNNQDETHRMVQCHICGRNITIASSFECSECHEVTCRNCFDRGVGTCRACADDRAKKKEQVYRQTLMRVFEDGRVDLSERRDLVALQDELGLSASRAAELEILVRAECTSDRIDEGDQLSTFEKYSFGKARTTLVVDGDANNAAELLKPIYTAHPLNEEILSAYLLSLVLCDESEAKRIIVGLQADVLCAYVSWIDICLKNDDMTGAESKLLAAETLWKTDSSVALRRAWFYCKMFAISADASYTIKAKEVLAHVDSGGDMLLRSLIYSVKKLISNAVGEDMPETTKEFCETHNLSFPFANGLLIRNL